MEAIIEERKSASPTLIPSLGMLIDRTSFDETDDFGINSAALQTSFWSNQQETDGYGGGPAPVMMRNGKVRRRLRWRPRSMIKRTRKLGASISDEISVGPTSEGSVISAGNQSLASRTSQKSVHSFASTETVLKSNTKRSKDMSKLSPLPRPNYPDHFALAGSRATIGTEGGMIHVKMDQTAHISQGEGVQHSLLDSNSSPKGGGFRKSGIPPLFQYRRNKPPEHHHHERGVLPFSKWGVHGGRNSSPGLSAASSGTSTAAVAPFADDEGESDVGALGDVYTVPSLSGDLVERERRVDLRIPMTSSAPVERRDTVESSSREQKHELKKSYSMPGGPTALSTGGSRVHNNSRVRAPSPSLVSATSQELTQASPLRKVSRSTPTPQSSTTRTLTSPAEELGDDDEYDVYIDHGSELQIVAGRSSPQSGDQHTVSPSVATVELQTLSEGLRDPELRFSMSDMPDMQEETTQGPSWGTNSVFASGADDEVIPPSPISITTKPKTGPVDMDSNSFLEVERNLKAIHDVAAEHLKEGEYEEALEVFEEILRGQLARYGDDHYRVATANHNIGIVYAKCGSYEDAIASYKEAVRIRKNTLGPNHEDVAVSLAQLGVAYLESQKYKKAISSFREALKIRRLHYGNCHPKVAKILNNIGCALYELDELEVAQVAFEEALEVHRQLLRDLPMEGPDISDSNLLSIASTQCNLASIKLYYGQFDEATVDLEEALLLQQCVLPDNHPVVRRTEESLVWVEQSRRLANGEIQSLGTAPSRFESSGRISTYTSADDMQSRTTSMRAPMDMSKDSDILPEGSMLDYLEGRFMRLHAKLELACGGAASDDER